MEVSLSVKPELPPDPCFFGLQSALDKALRSSLLKAHNLKLGRTTMPCRSIVLAFITSVLFVSAIAAPPAVTIKEWDVPTPNSRPHDPALAPDGSLWYTGQMANKLGRLDPKTMEIKEYELPQGARPRRLALAADGAIYYSDYARGFLGRLDPATGKVEEWPSPGGPTSKPYGIAITGDGTIWYSESGVAPNTLVSFDPKSKKFLSNTPIPSGGGVVRNMVATKEGKLYMACSGVNKVGIAEIR
jgi:virginiamycin B lyase